MTTRWIPRFQGLTALLEPIMIVFLAVVVGTIVMALFLPLIRSFAALQQRWSSRETHSCPKRGLHPYRAIRDHRDHRDNYGQTYQEYS